MSKVFKNGIVVTADRTWKADVLVQHDKFVAIGPHAAVNRALSTWKEVAAPRKVQRSGIPAGV